MLNDVYSLPFDSSRPEKLWGSQSVCREEGYLRELSDDGKRVILEFQEIINYRKENIFLRERILVDT